MLSCAPGPQPGGLPGPLTVFFCYWKGCQWGPGAPGAQNSTRKWGQEHRLKSTEFVVERQKDKVDTKGMPITGVAGDDGRARCE